MLTAWEFRGDKIYVATDEEGVDFQPFSCRFEVVEKRVDMISGVEELKIKVANGYSDPVVTIVRDELAETAILKILTKFGVSITDDKEFRLWVGEILMDTEADAKLTRFHNALGFMEVRGEEVFLADKIYGASDPMFSASVHADPRMQPKGGLKRYRRFLIEEVVQYPKLALAFALGATAPVAHILKKEALFREVPLWCFSGSTSIGKTTLLTSLLSLYGNPAYLLSNLNATSNALSTQISLQSGLPFMADEATHAKLDFDDLIYSLSAGKDKRRCNGDGSLKPLTEFSGAIFFSSEQPILDKCNDHGGEEARVLDFEFNWFDGDGEKAERFKSFFNTHYGVALEGLMKLIFDNRIRKKIQKNYRHIYRRLLSKAQCQDGVDRRIVSRLALILVSCWLLQKAVKVDFHMENIEGLLWEVFRAKKSRPARMSGAEMLLQLFMEDMVRNPDKYTHHSSKRHARHASYPPMGTINGSYDYFRGRNCVWIPKNQFQKILDQQTQYGSDTAKRLLTEAGYLEKFGNAYCRWYNFGAASANAFCLYPPVHDAVASTDLQETGVETSMEPLSILPSPKPKLVLGFVKMTAQDTHLVINKPLQEKMGITDDQMLWISPFPTQGTLFVTMRESQRGIPLIFHKEGEAMIATDSAINSIAEAMSFKMTTLHRLLLTDIEVYTGGTAIVNCQNPFGQWCGNIHLERPYNMQDIYPEKSKNQKINPSLLADEEEVG